MQKQKRLSSQALLGYSVTIWYAPCWRKGGMFARWCARMKNAGGSSVKLLRLSESPEIC